ncbi:MAG: GNAT family N-acetyltransferase [Clostridiales bacterium]|nr:GNAT family N-acetyltransferase [Clostridiales bacterium]
MKNIDDPWIKIKENNDIDDKHSIEELQNICILHDHAAFKLELDYKFEDSKVSIKENKMDNMNEWMYFNGNQLIGYMGIMQFGDNHSPVEINGMVHPEFRKQGVFKKLYFLVRDELKRRKVKRILLLCDRKSIAGQAFMAWTNALYLFSEYEMHLDKMKFMEMEKQNQEITLRKASNADAKEVDRQDKIYFNRGNEDEISTENMMMPEEEEKRGMTIYLAEKGNEIVGKVHIQFLSGIGGIYGLGIVPEYRGKGYGRAVIMGAINILIGMQADEIMLQVEARNEKALNLYKSCGFIETSTMDYFQINI